MGSPKKAKPEYRPAYCGRQRARCVISASKSFILFRRCVTNKCFRCDAVGLAILDKGQHSAGHAGGVRIGGQNKARTNRRGFEQVVPATRWDAFVSGISAWQI